MSSNQPKSSIKTILVWARNATTDGGVMAFLAQTSMPSASQVYICSKISFYLYLDIGTNPPTLRDDGSDTEMNRCFHQPMITLLVYIVTRWM